MIYVELGTTEPIHVVDNQAQPIPGPAVVSASIPAPEVYSFDNTVTGADVALKLARGEHLPGNEALEQMLCNDGWWRARSGVTPEWVSASDPEFERILSEFFGCTRGKPANLEARFFTRNGPPGVGPAPEPGSAPVGIVPPNRRDRPGRRGIRQIEAGEVKNNDQG